MIVLDIVIFVITTAFPLIYQKNSNTDFDSIRQSHYYPLFPWENTKFDGDKNARPQGEQNI
jgi:hypothetical protein